MVGPAVQPGNSVSGPGLIVSPLAETDVEEAARLYTDVFLNDEPTSRRHALEPARFFPFAQMYVQSLIKKDLSFLARDPRTGTLAGFTFCFDMNDDPAQESPQMAEFIRHFREAVAMIDELEARYLDRETIPRGSVLHIFQIGVDRHYRLRGVAQQMIRQALAHAGKRGFTRAIADCTNPASKQMFEHCGFQELGMYPYESFSMDGARFFSGLEGGISLMVKDLDSSP
jgi:ribosomal protein S18 acetylase RimI-like enzyme